MSCVHVILYVIIFFVDTFVDTFYEHYIYIYIFYIFYIDMSTFGCLQAFTYYICLGTEVCCMSYE